MRTRLTPCRGRASLPASRGLLVTVALLVGLVPSLYAQDDCDPLAALEELLMLDESGLGEAFLDFDPPPPPLRTIAKGDQSRWQHDNPDFAGATFVIGDLHAWGAFWERHAAPNVPPPPIDFRRDVVLVALQGVQPTGRGPNISLVEVHPAGPIVEIVAIDDPRPGPAPVVSNPFHIVAVERGALPPERSINFLRLRPLAETGIVTGHVLASPPQGQPEPLPGAHVMLVRQGAEPRHAVSGLDGSYFFVNIEPGEYLLRAEAPGFAVLEQPIVVPPNARVDRELPLLPLPPGRIAGRVLGVEPPQTPFPLPDALVQLFRHEFEVDRRRTGPEGEFVFERVLPGPYRLVASHEGFEPQECLLVVEPNGVVQHVFVLRPAPPPGAFEGFVLGLLPGGRKVPLPDALVRLMGPPGEVARAPTDPRGHFEMPEVPPGRFLAIAEKEGWRPGEAGVEIQSGQVTRHTFVLRRPVDPGAAATEEGTELEAGAANRPQF